MSAKIKPVKKLRFTIRKLQFSDMIPHFRAEPGETTRLYLTLSPNKFKDLRTEDVHNDCIAFSQLLRMKGIGYKDLVRGDKEAFQDLIEDFVILNFDVFSSYVIKKTYPQDVPVRVTSLPGCRKVTATPKQLAELLFREGFSVRNKSNGDTTKYVRFAGSASMTRSGSVMFVNRKYEPELSRRVTLGLEEDGCLKWAKDVIPSKWDAYKGLCLSDGYGLAWLKERNPSLKGADMELPELNTDTVAVIDDLQWADFIKGAMAPWQDCGVEKLGFEVPMPINKAGEVVLSDPIPKGVPERSKDDKLTDGVGLIDPRAARWLSAALCGDPDAIHTFQIRLPFVKGMLHSVDFKAYLSSRGVEKIRDGWRVERDVHKLQIILPKSMYKAHKWFDAQAGEGLGIVRYFEQFREYGHDLFITQRHLPKPPSDEPYRLNYEVLQTCGLQDFSRLLEDNLERYKMLRTDEETRIRYFTCPRPEEEELDEDSTDPDDLLRSGEQADEEDREETSEYEDEEIGEGEDETDIKKTANVRELLSKAIGIEPRLVRSKAAKRILSNACDDMGLNKILRGQLALPPGSHGESRYLSCDLGRYLDYLVCLDAAGKQKHPGSPFPPMSPGEFYAPGFPKKDGYCALFRTPHYSRNEHLVLRPRAGDAVRDKYFGKLTGVVMFPAEGFGPQRLGGADFDGDHTAIIDDSAYVGGLEKALGLNGLEGEARDRLGGSGLPFIDIPGAGDGSMYRWENRNDREERDALTGMEFRAFLASCENRVGMFSNYAFSHGAAAYGPQGDGNSLRIVQSFTALTGLEIDSVKSGKKPKLSKEAEAGKGVFLTLAQKIRNAEAKDRTWEKGNKQNGFFLSEELEKVENELTEKKKSWRRGSEESRPPVPWMRSQSACWKPIVPSRTIRIPE